MPKGLRKVQITVGEKNLTHFGGIILIYRFCKKLKLKRYLQTYVKFPHRYNLYHPVELILAIIYALIVGIHRLSKTKILQGNGANSAFQQIIGLKTYPYSSSVRRFLKRVTPKTIQGINKVHDHLRLKMFYLPHPYTSLLFDFDSSVLTIYGKFIEPLDDEGMGYTIIAKMTPPIKNRLGGLRYHRFRKDWSAAEFHYTPLSWKKPHRFVVIRRLLPEKDSEQLTLFTLKRYAYQVFVTNLTLGPESVWYFYRGRAAIETIIGQGTQRELYLSKNSNQQFSGKSSIFLSTPFAYNIVNWSNVFVYQRNSKMLHYRLFEQNFYFYQQD